MARIVAILVAIFVVATTLSGVISAAIAVYWFRDFDPKFRDAPSLAFEFELYGVLAVALVGVFVACVAAYLLRERLSLTLKSVTVCSFCAIVYPLLLRLIEGVLEAILGIDSFALPVAGWLYLIAFPALAVLLIATQGPAHAQST